MGRLFTDGAEEVAASGDLALTKWGSVSGTMVFDTTNPHSGARCYSYSNASTVSKRVSLSASVTSGEYFTRAYVRRTATPLGDRIFWTVGQVANDNAYWVLLDNGGAIDIQNRVSTTRVNGPTLTVNTWYRVEVRHLISDTVGELEVRVWLASDETTQVSGSPFGIGTFTGGNGTDEDTLPTNIQSWQFGGASGGGAAPCLMDDIAINDTSGTFQTSWPGAGKIAYAEPGGATSMAWEDTATTNPSLYTNVDDLPGTPDDATTYNKEDDTANQVDQMTLATLPAEIPADADMVLMDLYARVGSDGTSARTGRLKIWDETNTLTNGPSVDFAINGWRILSIGPTNEHQVFDLGTRSKANVQDFDIGYENITNVATRVRRVTALWANVEWIEGAGAAGATHPSWNWGGGGW